MRQFTEKIDNERFDQAFREGALYASLFIALPHSTGQERKKIESELARIYKTSRYVQEVVSGYADPISILANRMVSSPISRPQTPSGEPAYSLGFAGACS